MWILEVANETNQLFQILVARTVERLTSEVDDPLIYSLLDVEAEAQTIRLARNRGNNGMNTQMVTDAHRLSLQHER